MRDQTRYRVTGSLFLLALAVICLPMLFDGAGAPALELPDLDAAEVRQTLRDIPELPPTRSEATLEPLPERAAPQALAKQVEELRQQVDEQGFQQDTGTRFGEPVLSRVTADTDLWAVQVASFGDADNAREFVARLRGDGYEAFISTARSSAGVRSRVAVGPLLDRTQADALQREISLRYRLEAQLMAFSN